MSEQDTPMDALDRRLTAYLQGRAEMAAAFGPGPDHVAESIAAGVGRVALPGRRGAAGLRGTPALVWALLVLGLLAAMALAVTTGSDRSDPLVVLPPATPEGSPDVLAGSPLLGRWQLDFEASGIDGWYEITSLPKRSRIPVASYIEFADGTVSGGTGAGGGCDAFEGIYADSIGRLIIDLPAAAGHCGSGPVYPDLEVRQQLERAAAGQVHGDELRLLDQDGALLLLYRRVTTEMP